MARPSTSAATNVGRNFWLHPALYCRQKNQGDAAGENDNLTVATGTFRIAGGRAGRDTTAKELGDESYGRLG